MGFIIGLVMAAVGAITVFDFIQRKARYAKWKLALINARMQPETVPMALVDSIAALSVHVRLARGEGISDADADQLSELLANQFALSTFEAEAKLRQAFDALQAAPDLSAFARGIKTNMDQDGRQEVMRFLFKTVMAEREASAEELRDLMRVGALIGVSNNDCSRLQVEVQGSLKAAES